MTQSPPCQAYGSTSGQAVALSTGPASSCTWDQPGCEPGANLGGYLLKDLLEQTLDYKTVSTGACTRHCQAPTLYPNHKPLPGSGGQRLWRRRAGGRTGADIGAARQRRHARRGAAARGAGAVRAGAPRPAAFHAAMPLLSDL